MPDRREGYPYLVQRVMWVEGGRPERSGVDKYFSFDYMGSSEFEFGALGVCIGRMRSNPCVSEPKRIKVADKHVCWYVGREEEYESAKLFFTDQLSDERRRIKEATRIEESYGDSDDDDRLSYYRTIAWWNVDKGWHHKDADRNKGMEPWIIFMKKEHANIWLKEISK